ncbi:hemolysin activator protein, HlyB family [Pseudomonas protegens]|uniref:ShlB/FhaC/HecB family hemolysin secretion/activation protein n=1 Tax=Pseudomonas TaxID=286 RepID=UPI0008070808|nr:hemolysin activator protein, HlyB family [Pseudomonas protegens]OBZ28761.1 hemolysin activator protein, HlyB family [Pseudomonas protegens]OKK42246.1 hemolysin activator protein, HlyB family [Pseudomonas protegens]OKK43194.1 hemolysin activator protein, HlyB family [Pseudomonas protegens]OKK59991.1 hemolysin activator protein, HlyB family [Pseudomonas protegens]
MSLSTLGMRLCCALSCLLLFSALHSAAVAPMPGTTFNLGAQSFIRGYKDPSLNGDSGYCWRNHLRWTRPMGNHLVTGVSFTHSLERPEALSERETPTHFRLDFYL